MDSEKAKAAQQEVCKTALEMYRSGLVSGTWGNISARIDEEYMAITPSGMNYEGLSPAQMVIVNIDTLSYEGPLKPSIEAIVHAGIYKSRPEVNGIMHTHSTYALTVATARKEIPPICADTGRLHPGGRLCDSRHPGDGRCLYKGSGRKTGCPYSQPWCNKLRCYAGQGFCRLPDN